MIGWRLSVMKKFRTVAAVVIMFFAAMAGYFVGAALSSSFLKDLKRTTLTG